MIIDHTLGVVLNGGGSTRMGAPKHELEYLGVPFINHAVATLSLGLRHVVVVGGDYNGPVETLPDEVQDAGPLGGILTGLIHASPLPVMVLAVDLPLVTIELVQRLVNEPVEPDAVRFATDGEHPQPLCAVWGSGLPERISAYLADGERSVRGFVETLATTQFVMADAFTLTNINTPTDYAMLQGGATP